MLCIKLVSILFTVVLTFTCKIKKTEQSKFNKKINIPFILVDDSTDFSLLEKQKIELLKAWFLDDETKMNPNLNFVQAIPGKNTGRGIGIIEFVGITNIITAIEILELNEAMTVETSKGLRHWFKAYLYWLQTSENGVFEKNTKNNHAVWYDVQIVSILMFLDRKEEAIAVFEEVKVKRIATQIEPDGKQPHELARTKSLSYSTMNLSGFTQLAYLGKRLGVHLWNYKSENGDSIKKVYEYLEPYTKGEKEREYKQINSFDKANKSLKHLVIKAGCLFDVEEYCRVGFDKDTTKVSSLMYHCY